MKILPAHIHPSWEPFLTDDIRTELERIEGAIGSDYNPTDPNLILRFLQVDLDQVKVIWLGQDVYPAKGVATGRAFEVGGLNSWASSFRQVSLKNIIRLLHKNERGIKNYQDIKSFKDIKEEMVSGHFQISAPDKWFSLLEQQGVLFLNTSFTCKYGKPNSHKRIWEHFSKCVLSYISHRNPDIIWFLWGREAQGNKAFIEKGVFIESRHPMMCSSAYEDDFLKFSGFEQTKGIIDWVC
ncbi:uracil-DNA glycosylase [Bacillus sp. 1P06AnD]|uniref:uracil-DNA glycosylase n=1 Tax=Bacillus sp. 1P06AnD TaxID=3132208 RepID=UPI0039A16253